MGISLQSKLEHPINFAHSRQNLSEFDSTTNLIYSVIWQDLKRQKIEYTTFKLFFYIFKLGSVSSQPISNLTMGPSFTVYVWDGFFYCLWAAAHATACRDVAKCSVSYGEQGNTNRTMEVNNNAIKQNATYCIISRKWYRYCIWQQLQLFPISSACIFVIKIWSFYLTLWLCPSRWSDCGNVLWPSAPPLPEYRKWL